MRSKQALKNMIANVILQLLVSLSGIILPRMLIQEYGSTMNGLISSIGQFITYMSLVEAGIGAAAVVSLYLPIAENDTNKINSILSGAKKFYYKSGSVFLGLVLALVLFYPYFAENQVDTFTVRMMIVILAGSSVIDFFLLGKYRVLLTADQKSYVVAGAQSIGTLLNTVVTILLIELHYSAVIVKLIATIVYLIRFLIIYMVIKRQYKYLDFDTIPNDAAFSQRWDALIHQIAGIVVNNSAVVLLTIFGGANSLQEISVYTIYNLVIYTVVSFMGSFNNGLSAGFGQLIAKGEKENSRRAFSNYEYIFFVILFTAIICVCILLLPFIRIYTIGITDASYIRPGVAGLFMISCFLQVIRIPGLTMIVAAGHYAETRNRAILEAAINLTISLILIKRMQMSGVLIGAIISFLYRDIDIILYNAKFFVLGTLSNTIKRILRNTFVSVLIILFGIHFIQNQIAGWFEWFLAAICLSTVSFGMLLFVNLLCEKEEFNAVLQRIKSVLGR